MSKLPKNLPFNELEINNLDGVSSIKSWLKTFVSDFRKLYENLYNELENDSRKKRSVSADPSGTATYGFLSEIVFYNDHWYGKTVATGNDTNWILIA